MWKKIRIGLLLFVLFLVAADAYLTHYRAVSWDDPLWVAIYPINPDHDPVVEQYISQLSDRSFKPIETFFEEEAETAHLPIKQPFKVLLAHEIEDIPPSPPPDHNRLKIMWWSLKLRWWAITHNQTDYSPNIKMFVMYHNYEKVSKLEHSLGLEKGMIGVVNAYANRRLEGRNNVVIAHEMLHTVGATDKYNFQTSQPIFPDGFAEPDKHPLYPQDYAELMAGHIPLSESKTVMPISLDEVVVGPKTMEEINWRQ